VQMSSRALTATSSSHMLIGPLTGVLACCPPLAGERGTGKNREARFLARRHNTEEFLSSNLKMNLFEHLNSSASHIRITRKDDSHFILAGKSDVRPATCFIVGGNGTANPRSPRSSPALSAESGEIHLDGKKSQTAIATITASFFRRVRGLLHF